MTHRLTKNFRTFDADVFVAEDNSAFRRDRKAERMFDSAEKAEIYFKEMFLLINALFEKGEINLAAYLLLSRYVSRVEPNDFLFWDLNKLIETAKQERGLKFRGKRNK